MKITFAGLPLVLTLAACGNGSEPVQNHAEAEVGHGEEGVISLTPRQIATAGIEVVSPTIGGNGGAIERPALLESDPQATRIVAATVPGRIVELRHNLGDSVRRGETLAVLESREAAGLQAEVQRAAAGAELARTTLARDEALYTKGFRPLREVQISRAAAKQADVALRLAREQVAASGARGGSYNRIVIAAPISGQVIARSAMLGQTFAADAAETELFRVARLDRLSVTLSLSPADAGRVRPGMTVQVTAPGRSQAARIGFVSPALDTATRQVPAIAMLDNRAGQWRAGEPVTAAIQLPGTGDGAIRVPSTAVQTVEGRTVVFVRTDTGFRAVPVTLGRQDGAMVVVTAGLTGRERIAAANSFTLKSALGAAEAGHED
ncbi:efflux RND transporter periplasmic adaptor subunit [Sphingomonas psychrotolerans]|uniref:Efflux RND transporter periplasmic adaptor subunit n=1 Tax=Sphingomonas psychrotolerans TaxID=1327635 RepID=A0A2K8MDJ4_9SPHN|nr:efflux RND transporter periplasmic adaptor subunit [Sphingomonas psychrotolerans]ATY31958.1 efflux RND transporter periplasmic adaptor subunit [Sphingomonas psychrotolerans]